MKKKYVMIVSSGILHPALTARIKLRRLIREAWNGPVRIRWSLIGLERLNSQRHAAVVLFFHREVISPLQLERLEKFAHSGGGVLAVNSAVTSFGKRELYGEILGARCREPDRRAPLVLKPAGSTGETFPQPEVMNLKDRLSRFSLSGDVTVRTIGPGNRPASWTRIYGKGRIFCFAPGENAATYRISSVRRHLTDGFLWITSPEQAN